MNDIVQRLKPHFFLSFDMLETMIDACPDRLWNQKHGGFLFWQQVLHAFHGNQYWTRPLGKEFIEPFAPRLVYPELDHDPVDRVSQGEMRAWAAQIREQNQAFFADKTDAWLTEASAVQPSLTNLDVVVMQIRHLQYHVGHCNAILRENRVQAVEWIE